MDKSQQDEMLKLDNQLCFPLYACSRKIVNYYTPFLKPLGITYTQYLVLLVLWEKDDVMVSTLCSRLHLDSGTLTPLLKKLAEDGLVARKRSEDDERKVFVTLTEKGKQLKEKAYEIPLKVGSCIHLEKEEAEFLYKILYKIINYYES